MNERIYFYIRQFEFESGLSRSFWFHLFKHFCAKVKGKRMESDTELWHTLKGAEAYLCKSYGILRFFTFSEIVLTNLSCNAWKKKNIIFGNLIKEILFQLFCPFWHKKLCKKILSKFYLKILFNQIKIKNLLWNNILMWKRKFGSRGP